MAKARPVSTEDPQTKRLRAHGTQLTLSKRHDLAEPIWRELLTRLPRDPGLHRQLANCLLNLRRNDEAFEEAQAAVTLNPASYQSLSMLGLMHRVQGRYEQATVAHRQALELKPDYLPALLGMALDHMVQLRWPEALDWANRGLAVKPGHVELLRIRGKALAITGQHDEARVVMDEFLRLAPDESESHRAAAIILRRLGCVAEAADFARRAMVMNPADPGSHNYLAALKLHERKFDEADRHFKDAAEIYDSRRDGQKGEVVIEINSLMGQAAVNMNRRRLALAEMQYRRVTELRPEHTVAKALLAGVIGIQKRFQEAFALAREAIDADPKQDVPRRVMASLLKEVERFDEAHAMVDDALLRQPDSREWLLVRTGIYLNQEDYPKAFEAVERVMTIGPTARSRRAMAAALAGLGRTADAVTAIELALTEEAGTFGSEASAGYVYYLLGDHTRAESHLLRAMALDESGLGCHGALGLVYAAQKRVDEARKLLVKALGQNPNQWQIQAALAKLELDSSDSP